MKLNYVISIAFYSLMMVFVSCDTSNEPKVLAPTATIGTTAANAEQTYTSININGSVTSDGGSEIIDRGVCWSTNQNPTISDNKTAETEDSFTATISDLVANTTYYFRVYATNDIGTSYSEEQAISTSSLNDTTWDFLVTYSSTVFWHADVVFNADGSTVYDEPENPGIYKTYGTWSLSGNTLTYDFDSSSPDSSFKYSGTLLNNTMSGKADGGELIYTWSATKY